MVIVSRKLDESGQIVSEPDNLLLVLVENSFNLLLNKTCVYISKYDI